MSNEDRPLTARSVLASALLGELPPELPVSQLIRLAALFGINENRARVALSRMVSTGELGTNDGHYRLLSSALLHRQTRQQQSLEGVAANWAKWDGKWKLVVITAPTATAADRGARRKLLTQARFAERRDGVWMRPDNLDRSNSDVRLGPGSAGGSALAGGSIEIFVGHPEGDPIQLAAALWNLAAWHDRALTLISRMDDVPALTPEDLAPGFVLSASILRHVQADPLLPEDLLPADWPGRALRERYNEWNSRYRLRLRPTKQQAVNTPRQ